MYVTNQKLITHCEMKKQKQKTKQKKTTNDLPKHRWCDATGYFGGMMA